MHTVACCLPIVTLCLQAFYFAFLVDESSLLTRLLENYQSSLSIRTGQQGLTDGEERLTSRAADWEGEGNGDFATDDEGAKSLDEPST